MDEFVSAVSEPGGTIRAVALPTGLIARSSACGSRAAIDASIFAPIPLVSGGWAPPKLGSVAAPTTETAANPQTAPYNRPTAMFQGQALARS